MPAKIYCNKLQADGNIDGKVRGWSLTGLLAKMLATEFLFWICKMDSIIPQGITVARRWINLGLMLDMKWSSGNDDLQAQVNINNPTRVPQLKCWRTTSSSQSDLQKFTISKYGCFAESRKSYMEPILNVEWSTILFPELLKERGGIPDREHPVLNNTWNLC